jgi:ABC-2 type transport system permease protein
VIPYVSYANPSEEASGFGRIDLATLLPAGLLGNVISGFPLFGAAFLVIIGALVAGSEYGWGTLATILVQRPRRLQVLGGKLLALGVVAVVFELVTLGLGAVASSVVAAAEDAPRDWPSLWQTVRALGAGWLVFAVYATAGASRAILFRGTSLPIGLGLVHLLVVETLIAGFATQLDLLRWVQEALPRANAGSLASAFITTEGAGAPGVVDVVGPARATVVLIGYAGGFALLAGQLLHRRDVT